MNVGDLIQDATYKKTIVGRNPSLYIFLGDVKEDSSWPRGFFWDIMNETLCKYYNDRWRVISRLEDSLEGGTDAQA